MFRYRRIGLLVLVILAILVAAVMAQLKNDDNIYTFNNQHKRGQVDEEQWPLADTETHLPSDSAERAKRLARGKKYDKPKLVVEPNADYGQSMLNDHWFLSIPALPTAQSNVIVIGDVISSQAYLSNNKEGVYSEFGLQVERVLKDDKHIIAIGNTIDVEREGGRVRQSSGRITRYSINGQNMPLVGKRYLFFLTCADPEQAFHIITGFELRAGKVFPLDEAGDKFDLYKGMDETAFFDSVKEAARNP
ncbi:MAG TPA: hypothetical protein VGX92_16635 [Pyrinomonadaceae bacterium]|jgi:hypothetical protein|nr:hypothetical protein [Pyrinomonadaceae bacterium]